jgi:NhaA family Na+:H+ antiporter
MFISETLRRFTRSEQFGGVLLIACTVVSLALANSPFGDAWIGLWHLKLGPLSVEHWINDALMAVFFLMIGLELERGIYVGALSEWRNALLPAFAAIGGMAAPALVHFAFNAGTDAESGFGIPMATDIAFALAVMALLGPRIPAALKLFVVAYAVIDDLGAIVLIATVYTAQISAVWLALALGIWAALLLINRLALKITLTLYLIGGVFLWYCVYRSGIHASIAGVMLAFAVPFSANVADAESPSHRLERWLHKPVAYVILPLFALANTGVVIDADAIATIIGPNGLGIVLGLLAAWGIFHESIPPARWVGMLIVCVGVVLVARS